MWLSQGSPRCSESLDLLEVFPTTSGVANTGMYSTSADGGFVSKSREHSYTRAWPPLHRHIDVENLPLILPHPYGVATRLYHGVSSFEPEEDSAVQVLQ